MLYWICPECGHECSPAVRECPTCTAPPVQQPAAGQTGTSLQLLSLAQSFHSTRSAAAAATAVSIEAQPKEDAPPTDVEAWLGPELSGPLTPLEKPAIRPAPSAGWTPVQLSPAPVPVPIPPLAIARGDAPARAESVLVSAGPAPLGNLSFQPAPGSHSRAIGESAEPLPSRRQSVAFVRPEPSRANHGGLALADLDQSDAATLKPVVAQHSGRPTQLAYEPLLFKPSELSVGSSELKLAGESLVDLASALKISDDEIERAAITQAIQAIQSSFSQQPSVCLLPAPAEVVAPAPPAAQWIQPQKPKFSAIASWNLPHPAVAAGPQAPPLAGPSLPPQLLKFELQSSSLRPKRRRMSSWPLSLMLAVVIILGAVSLVQYLSQDRDTKAASIAGPAQPTKAGAAPAPPAAVVQEHPAARSVEVAGVRIVTGPNKRPQLQYIVINHSSNELTGLNIRIAVRSVDKLGDAPLFSVSNVVAVLGPNQSKEIHTELNPSIQPSDIPDWQSLRTEILVARQ